MKRTAIIGLGILALTATHAVAQIKPAPAYIVAEFEVIDAAGWKQFGAATTPLVKSHGGQFVSRGNKPVAAAGEPPKASTIVMFESMEKAQAYLTSPEYKALVPNRDKSAKFRSYVIGGGDAAAQ
jgi:uncharacterized protein (DUF1330 family)